MEPAQLYKEPINIQTSSRLELLEVLGDYLPNYGRNSVKQRAHPFELAELKFRKNGSMDFGERHPESRTKRIYEVVIGIDPSNLVPVLLIGESINEQHGWVNGDPRKINLTDIVGYRSIKQFLR